MAPLRVELHMLSYSGITLQYMLPLSIATAKKIADLGLFCRLSGICTCGEELLRYLLAVRMELCLNKKLSEQGAFSCGQKKS